MKVLAALVVARIMGTAMGMGRIKMMMAMALMKKMPRIKVMIILSLRRGMTIIVTAARAKMG